MNSADSEHQAPLVSTAMVTNKWVDVMVAYFAFLFAADFAVAAHAETGVDDMCDAGVWDYDVPCQRFSARPETRVASSGRFLSARNSPTGSLFAGVGVSHSSSYEVVEQQMADMARCALTTRRAMKPSGINYQDAGVRLAYDGAKVTASCHANCFVGQAQTDGRERWSMKPVADVLSHQRLQSCLIDGRGAC